MANKKSIEQLLEKRLKVETLSGYVLIGSLVILIVTVLLFYRGEKKNDNYCFQEMDRMKEFYFGAMNSIKLYCDVPEDIEWGVNGLYYHGPDYYCVNTKNKNTSEIMETDYHEMCHNLVIKEREHFCKDE